MTFDAFSFTSILAQVTSLGESSLEQATAMGLWPFFAQLAIPLALGLGTVGSAIGIGIAGRAAAGAWAKEARAGQGLRFTYIILLGMPISQTLYAMIIMNRINSIPSAMAAGYAGLLLAAGLATGLAEMFSAWMQGCIGAAGIRAISEGEGKGFAFLLIAMGIAETVGIFAMVFILGLMPKIPAAAETVAAAVAG